MDKYERFWDNQANEYDKNEERFQQIYTKTVTKTQKYLQSGDIVLDFGCGTGLITNEIAGYVKEIQAIDISSKMIAVARIKASERNIRNINYLHANIFDSHFASNPFNVVTAFNILHLIENPVEVLRRINELLIPKGFFISATASMGEKKSWKSKLLSILSSLGIVPYIKNYKLSDLKEMIENADFHIIETESLQQNPANFFIVAKKL